jgi:hypothetical protein
MNKTESQQNLSLRVNAAVELEAAHYLLSTYSSPCFGVKIVYNYGLWCMRGESIKNSCLTGVKVLCSKMDPAEIRFI